MPFFGKKPNKPNSNPVEQVTAMKQQGLDNNQIIDALQNQGYGSDAIFDALNQADMSANYGNQMTGAPYEQYPQQPEPQQFIPPPPPAEQQINERPLPEIEENRIQEIAEAIIDEKWNEFLKDFNRIIEWKEKNETRITKIEQEIQNIKENFDSLHKGILGKITEYDRNILDVGSQIKAMEKVFQDVIPTFTENVNKLSYLTKGMDKAKKK